ncbi:MAG: glycosyltransferase family 39 protein [Bacteroidota bacterium]|nr:glycosyltransferase family 39 protein [Bacteroidota bacterium]
MKKIFQDNILLFFIIFIGTLLRVWHINWGLPDLYEEAMPLSISWRFWNIGATGYQFDPNFFTYPAFTFYLQFLIQNIHYLIGNIFGVYPGIASFLQAFEQDSSSVIIIARLTTVLFDVATIIIAYKLISSIIDKRTSLLAASLLALNPLHVKQAHFINVDTPLTFFVILSLYFIIKLMREQSLRNYIGAGISIGLAASTKYNGAILLVVLLIAQMLRSDSIRNSIKILTQPRLLISVITSIVVFILWNPYIILRMNKFLSDFGEVQRHMEVGHLGVDQTISTFDYYLLEALPAYLSWILLIVCCVTIYFFFKKKEANGIVLAIFPILYLIIIGRWEMRADRYIFPAIPILILIGSIGVMRLWDIFQKYLSNQPSIIYQSKIFKTSAVIIGLFILLIQPVVSNYKYLQPLGLPDTRAIAKKWINDNLPLGSVIATGPYGVEFPGENRYVMFRIPYLSYETELAAPFYDARWYEDLDLLITSDYDYGRFQMEPKRYIDFLGYYDTLRTCWKSTLTLQPDKDKTGPTLWLYTYPDSLTRSKFDPSMFERFHDNPESTRISNFLKDLNTILYKKGKLEKCEQILNEILIVEVENVTVRNQLAQVLFDRGEYEQTLGHLGLSIQHKPEQPHAYVLAGRSLLKLNKVPEAEGVFHKTIMMDNQLETPYLELIQLYTVQKEKLKLFDILKRYLAILPPKSQKASEIKKQIEELDPRRKN